MLKKLFAAGQWVNFLTLAAQLLNQATDAFPALKASPWVLLVQGLIGAILPSVGGLAHRAAFAEAQAPADRTTAEVVAAAKEVKATLIEATPAGQAVAVPTSTSTVVAGTKTA